MNRSDIIATLCELHPKINRRDVELLVRNLFGTLVNSIALGRRVEIRGFASFLLKKRKPGTIRNPRAGISLHAKERHVVYFKAGKELKYRVDMATSGK